MHSQVGHEGGREVFGTSLPSYFSIDSLSNIGRSQSNALTCEPIPIYYDAASITASIADAFACDITAIHVDTPALTTVDDQEEEEVADADVDADADADDTATEADIEEVDTSLALCRVQSRMYPSHTTTTTDDDEEESAVTNGLPTFHSFSSLPPFVGDDEFDEGENDREEGEKYEHDEEEYENDEYYNDEEECESDEEEYGEDEEEIVWYFPMPPRKFGPLEIIVERDETEYEEK